MASPLGFLSEFFKKPGQSVLGIDIGTSSIKVVQLKKERGAAVLETYGELALGPYAGVEIGQATNLAPEKVAESLKDLVRESAVTIGNGGVAIPFAKTLLTAVSMPKRTEEEMRTMIPLEARKYIPVPITEVQLDWFVIPDAPEATPEEQQKSDVLLVAVANDALANLADVVKRANLTAAFYEIEIFSSIRAVLAEPVKPVVIVDIGAASTKIYVVARGVVMDSHRIPRGGQDVTQAVAANAGVAFAQAEHMKKEHGLAPDAPLPYRVEAAKAVYGSLLATVSRVIVEYESKRHQPVAEIIFTGGGSAAKGLKAFAAETLTHQITIGDPFSRVDAPAFMRDVLAAIGPEFSVALGLALRELAET